MLKWRLLLTTIPYVLGVVCLALLRDHVLHFQGILDFTEVTAVLTAGAFLIGFMLSGTMSDYKESEKLPSELACVLETIEENVALACVKKSQFDLKGLRRRQLALTQSIEDFLLGRQPIETVFATMSDFSAVAHELEREGSYYAGRVLGELHNLRKVVTRINVINKTSFLQSGYALLETMVTAIIVLLLVSRFRSPIAQYTLITFISLVYIYMVRLIRDVDSPFEYSPTGKRMGAAEVDPFPLLAYRERAAARMESTPEWVAPVVEKREDATVVSITAVR
jgi:hypothetical protein